MSSDLGTPPVSCTESVNSTLGNGKADDQCAGLNNGGGGLSSAQRSTDSLNETGHSVEAAGLPPSIPMVNQPARPGMVREDRPKRREQRVFPVPTLRHFQSTQRVPQVLESLVTKALSENRLLDHILLHGLPGCGSAAVAQALTREYAPKRCVEFDALEGCTPRTLARAIDRVSGGGLLLIRHIEVLDASCDMVLGEALGRGEPTVGTKPANGESTPSDDDSVDERISRSARVNIGGNTQRRGRRACDFTLIGTAHFITRIGYRVRTRFDHMIHLRKDPRGLRAAVVGAVARHGVVVGADTYSHLEQFLRTTDDCAEQVVHALVTRANIEGVSTIDATLTASVITEDLPCRIADETYATSLQRHLGGRRVTEVSDEEVARINSETGWGESAVRGALFLIVHDDRTKRGHAA
jgi:Holliday junction resolvasome RuvABC ATP-dependent DNA helicase subunit